MRPNEHNMPASSHCDIYKMTITCGALCPWPVVVKNSKGISIADIFHKIYETYRVPMTHEERVLMKKSIRSQPFVDAFTKRCQDSANAGEGGITMNYHIQKGPLRIDMLYGKRIFNGLKQTGDNEWEMLIHSQWWES